MPNVQVPIQLRYIKVSGVKMKFQIFPMDFKSETKPKLIAERPEK